MKKKLLLVFLSLLAAMCLCFAACSPKEETPAEPELYTVTFVTNGGSAIPEQGVYEGNKITKPGDPTRGGYTFVAWYKEEGLINEWEFETDVVTGNTTLYAKWEFAPATSDDYFSYSETDDGYIIAGKLGQTLPSAVVIPAEKDGKAVVEIADAAFEGQEAITTVIIPDSVKVIGARAFRNCANLATVEEANNIEYIAANAFYGTEWDSNLTGGEVYLGKTLYKYAGGMYTATEVTVKDGTLALAAGAFQDMKNLTKITLPAGLKTIGDYALGGSSDGTGLTEIVIPDSVETIGNNAFRNDAKLAKVTVGSGVVSIGTKAFAGTAISELTYNANAMIADATFEGLTAEAVLTVGDAVTALPVNLTKGWTGLKKVTLGTSVTDIPESAFDGLSNLADAEFKADLKTIGNYAFRGTALTDFTVDETVESIGAGAFANNTKLATLNYNAVNAKATTNTGVAFAGCTSLETVTIGDSVKAIPAYLFYNVSSVKTLKFGTAVQTIGMQAFAGTGIGGELALPASVTEIEESAFDGIAVTKITIGENVATIGQSAFANNEALTTVVFNAKSAELNGTVSMFANCSSINAITFGENVTKIPARIAEGNANITSVTLPKAIQSVGDYAFRDAIKLATVSGVDNVKAIGQDAFLNTPFLETYLKQDGVVYLGTILMAYNGDMPANFALTVREGTTAIAAGAFNEQRNLASVSFPDTLESIGDKAFYYCSGISGEIVFPDSLKSIGEQAFYRCSKISGITLGDQLISIGASAFENCSSAKMNLVLPETLTELGERAFYSCSGIESIEVKAALTKMPNGVFSSAKPTSVKLPSSVTELGDNWCGLSKCTEFVAPGVKVVGANGLSGLLDTSFDFSKIESFGTGALYNIAASSVTIGAGCKTIGDNLFASVAGSRASGTTNLVSVTIEAPITAIPTGMFRSCSSLREVKLPDTVTEIGQYAFDQCKSLTSFDFSNITKIADYAFSSSGIQSANFSDNLSSLGSYAFSDSKLSGELVLGQKLSTIPQWAFKGTQLTKVTIKGNIKTIDAASFRDSKNLKTVIIEKGVETIVGGAFMSLANGELTLAAGVKSMAGGSLTGFSKIILNEYWEPDTVALTTSDSNSAFSTKAVFVCKDATVQEQFMKDDNAWAKAAGANWNTTWKNRFITEDNFCGENNEWVIATDGTYIAYTGSKTVVVIPKELKTLPAINVLLGSTTAAANATITCEEGGNFIVKDGVLMDKAETTVYTFLFQDGITSFSSDTVTTVKSYAFYNAKQLKEVNLPNLETIETYAFYGSELTSITLENIKTIDKYAFQTCKSLQSVTIGAKCESIGMWAFTGGNASLKLTIKATTPPTLGATIVANTTLIYVPADSVETYKANKDWSAYAGQINAITEEAE